MVGLRNTLKQARRNAGLSQQALAGLAGISRQAYTSLESGRSNPSTEAALRLARALATSVDNLFSLEEDVPGALEAELVGVAEKDADPSGFLESRRAQLFQVGHRLLARPLSASTAARLSLVAGDCLIVAAPSSGKYASVRPFDDQALDSPALSVLGCDPAVAFLESGLWNHGIRLVWTEEGSREALAGLDRGEAHVAGCHLMDEATGTYNLSWVQQLVHFPCTLVTFAAWQQGLMVAPGNPMGINGVEDLARPNITIVNRQPGSGTRSLLDRKLASSGIPPQSVAGYERELSGHLGVAAAVYSGAASAGVGVKAAANAMGLDFLPLEEERYDLVIPNHFLDDPGVQVLLDLLRRPALHRRVESLGGYDVADMGKPVS